ncbi:MAG: plastocyanin/azurin family copper-binding protein [Acidimicrobiales bacterium]|nr:hypothetical protein [Acidimicrobiales bacterium]
MGDTATTSAPSTAPQAVEGSPDGDGERRSGSTFESMAVVAFVFGVFAIVIAVFALGLAARAVSESGGAASDSGPKPATLAVSAKEFAFDPSDAEIATTGTITLTNDGTVEHDLVVQGLTTGSVAPGESGELVLDGVAPGEYDYYCSIPGHRDAGMEGRILVG